MKRKVHSTLHNATVELEDMRLHTVNDKSKREIFESRKYLFVFILLLCFTLVTGKIFFNYLFS